MSLPRFGVTRPVPINILMAVVLIAGIASGLTMTREFFPRTAPRAATVTLSYPGATPEEIEQSLVKKVEEALADLDEVERLTTTISEGGGSIHVEFRDGIGEVSRATDKIKRAIDALQDLPEEADRIEVAEFEPTLPVIMISLYGEIDPEALKRAVNAMRDDLLTLPGMGKIVLSGVRDYEIRVDVRSGALLEHRLSLPQVSAAIRASMADVPGGTVRTGVGNVNVRTVGVAERSEAIRRIVVQASGGGGVLRVGDIATVRETYVDRQIKTRFRTRSASGPAASVTIYKTGDEDAVSMAEMARAYVQGRRRAAGEAAAAFETRWTDRLYAAVNRLASRGGGRRSPPLRTQRRAAYELGLEAAAPLPAGGHIETSSDLARFIEGRLDLLKRNAAWGGLLVFATLLLFLNWRSAVWVGMGLVTALCGTLLFMRLTGTTLNLLTMFGLIVVLGLLVDDAIVVAENIQARHERHEPGLVAAIKGTEEVLWPVVATVLTSIVAFIPLSFIKGQIGDLLDALPWVVACALAMSLVEALLILPSHMGHSLLRRDRSAGEGGPHRLRRLGDWRDRMVLQGLVPAYARLLRTLLRYRYLSVSAAVAILLVSIGMVAGGRTEFVFIPPSDSETVIIDLEMPIGTALGETERIVQRLERAAAAQPETRTVYTLLGIQAQVDETRGIVSGGSGTNLGQLFVELLPVEQRDRESSAVIASIRDQVGTLDGIESLGFEEIQGGPGGKDITVEITGYHEAEVRSAAREVRGLLGELEGVRDIADDDTAGQREVRVHLRPGAAGLGFTVADVARQVRGALFGLKPHVFSDRREDIDVRVRLDEASRRSLPAIENMCVVGADGRRVPLQEIARLSEGNAYTTIRRVDRRRTITVTADTAPHVSPETIVPELKPAFAGLQREHPSIAIRLAGRQRQLRKAFGSLPVGFGAALAMIYVILAWLFSSYVQPLAVMLAIPFALVGAIWGHVLLGYEITFFSIIGFVALSGIVVNDSLILMDFYNGRRAKGLGTAEALISAGRQRLRPILLTTITTVLGLTPLMLERSFQAKFLIPMAVSISFGLMSATALILVVLPCLIVIFEDIKAAAHYLWFGLPRGEPGGAGAGARGSMMGD